MDALRFACQPGCTNCCRQRGYVYLTEEDLRRASAYLQMTVAEFEQRYVYRTRHLIRLRIPPGSTCHFLEENGCRIHPAKPTQCRAFPFWPELVESRDAWNETSQYCPGIGTGPLIQIGTALEIADEMRRGQQGVYRDSVKSHQIKR